MIKDSSHLQTQYEKSEKVAMQQENHVFDDNLENNPFDCAEREKCPYNLDASSNV